MSNSKRDNRNALKKRGKAARKKHDERRQIRKAIKQRVIREGV